VPKTEHRFRLLHLSATGNGFVLVTAFLMLAALSACGGEPATAPAESSVSVTNDLFASSADLFSGSTSTNLAPTMFSLELEPSAHVPTEASFEKARQPGRDDAFQLVHKNLTTSSRSSVAFSVQAGYERIWDDKSLLAQISGNHQEVGCAYVRASLSF
jgi:hypothetical protein